MKVTDETTNEGNSAETVAGRRRIAKILLITLAIFIVLVQVATFVSRAKTASSDASPEVYRDAGWWAGHDYIEIDAQVLSVLPTAATESVRPARTEP